MKWLFENIQKSQNYAYIKPKQEGKFS